STLHAHAPASRTSWPGGRPAARSQGGAARSVGGKLLAVRKVWWALIGALCLLSLFGLATYLGIWNPAIARMKGEVTYVRPVADETRICLSHPVDAGST